MKVELAKEFRFEAAHSLPNVPEGHKCRRMHGHSFRGEVFIRGEVDEKVGWLIDYAEIQKVLRPIVDRLDHYLLNEIPGLENPTSEQIAAWLWREIEPKLPMLHSITIEETCTSRCNYYGE